MQGFSFVLHLKETLSPSETKEAVAQQPVESENETLPEKVKPTTVELSFEKDTLTVVGLGDSLTKGIGSTDNTGYLSHIETNWKSYFQELTIKNHAKLGRKSNQVLEDLEKEKVQESVVEADVIFLTVGGNDIMRVVKKEMFKVTLEEIEKNREPFYENLNIILLRIHELNPNAHVMLVGLYNPFTSWISYEPEAFKALDTWNGEYLRLDEQHDFAHYIQVKDVFNKDTESLLYKDRFHPNDEGYLKMAESILNQVKIKDRVGN